ncbi:amino acid ABC transporter permease [Pelagibacterium halotolerans]|uniref:Putative amino acid ABC transporter permease protein n=1 Tax=Pelagibacterium halotolerans (strain DSM 22347 / JCM 15775 / CGMCC 1.7692 / B2) TaxID=1082931 RepID=G4RD37_PELHB|nr:amino acid ABC transporter permease [Pelagibacterium halotolerans]AEQ53787.1 putative amino acid ABC transporter permease protein [Pelagibacterium halotolerans B2]QJR20055.1 amino acid ABC transporter permease [Pelagibacterium halotolerans]SEA81013.1 general L-amino acid transport system permease protein [Pelagibacterium halotolerans]
MGTALENRVRREAFWRNLRQDYFASPAFSLITVISVGALLLLVWQVVNWGLFDATFSPDARQAECAAKGGACWSVIANRWRIILFGLYPFPEHWRSGLACLVVVVVVVLSCIPYFWTARRLSITWLVGYGTFYVLMKGGVLGLPLVREAQWGGLALTLFIFTTMAVIGMPLSIAFALMRNSRLYWISRPMGVIIDGVRALPNVSILFTFAVVLPFMMPDMLVGEKLYRVIAGFILFFAAYQAEIIRGGMQAVAGGQEEAAKALGLSYRHRISRIVLPQAFHSALPATINQFVMFFMETTLVSIIGFSDLMSSARTAFSSGEWTFAFIEVYVFIAVIYFVFVFSLSRYGAYLERRMAVGSR